ncbi:MAG TPA: rhomboid family intramembrane serine protease [Vicinamibacterales bacterium]|nr:rhomboid family intramembrane serine protease [Vicinamibacterales bacterium]
MFKRQRTGSVVCPGCGSLVGVNDDECYTCGRRNPGLWGFAPVIRNLGKDLGFVQFIMVASIGLYLATMVASRDPMSGGGLSGFLAPDVGALYTFGASGAIPVFYSGRWWTVLSAAWLHGSLVHIFFNMLWVRQLGPEMAELYGAGRTVIIYTAASVVGYTLSSIMGVVLPDVPFIGGAGISVGASAPIFGLLGALVYYGRRMGSSHIGATAWQYAVVLFLFGLFWPRIDNWAHAGGYLGGYLAARWLDPSRRERGDHIIGGLACLVATMLAVAWSVLSR